MALGKNIVNTTESDIVIFGIKFKPSRVTFIPENLLRKSETEYYLRKGLLVEAPPTETTRVVAKSTAKPKASEPKASEPKAAPSTSTPPKTRRRRRSKKAAASSKD